VYCTLINVDHILHRVSQLFIQKKSAILHAFIMVIVL